MSVPILSLDNLHKRFPGVVALNSASLNIYPGEVMALMGENGAGKSTLMKVLTGIEQADAGDLFYHGQNVRFAGPRASQQAGISMIHQELNLIPELSIGENIFLGREPCHRWGNIHWRQLFVQTEQLLARLQISLSPKTLVKHLPLGTQQMVEIAKALSLDAKILILDEPTDALTQAETETLFKVIDQLKQEGCAMVYISHRLPEIYQIAERVTILRDGTFVGEHRITDLSEAELIEAMVGRKLEEQYPQRLPISEAPLRLQAERLSGAGVKQASFQLHAGEILGVCGLMGSGRTELAKLIYGLSPCQGHLALAGETLCLRHPRDALDKGIVYISEDRKHEGLLTDLSIKVNMTLSALSQFGRSLFLNQRKEQQAIKRFIDFLRIKTPNSEQLVKYLSGGNQQKVALAKGLMLEPSVLILDEPTRGVDVGAKREIYDLMAQFRKTGMSILLISSEMPELLGMSDRIMVMHEGQSVATFTHAEATQEKLLAAALTGKPH